MLGRVLYAIVSEEPGVEDKVTFLLQELTRNRSTHAAVASQAIPLLLRAATKSSQRATQNAALGALSNLSTSEHVVDTIIMSAFETGTLVPLLWLLCEAEGGGGGGGAERGKREEKEESEEILRKDSIMSLLCTLDRMTLAASVGVRARTQGELEQLLSLVVDRSTPPLVRRFALRTMEDTIMWSGGIGRFQLDWTRLLAGYVASDDPRDDLALLSLLRRHVVMESKAQKSEAQKSEAEKSVGDMSQGGMRQGGMSQGGMSQGLQPALATMVGSSSVDTGNTLVDALVEWSARRGLGRRSSTPRLDGGDRRSIVRRQTIKELDDQGKRESAVELCRTFSLEILAHLTATSFSSTTLQPIHLKHLLHTHCQCVRLQTKLSTLPPYVTSSHQVEGEKKIKKNETSSRYDTLQKTLLHESATIATIVRNVARHSLSDVDALRMMWGDVAVSWLYEAATREAGADVLTACLGRESSHCGGGGGRKEEEEAEETEVEVEEQTSAQKWLLAESWMSALAMSTGSCGSSQESLRVMKEMRQGESKPILVTSTSNNKEGAGDAVPSEESAATMNKRFSGGNARKQSHSLKALALSFESPDNILRSPSLSSFLDKDEERRGMEQKLQHFIAIGGWNALEAIMSSDHLHESVKKNGARAVANLLSCDLAWFDGRLLSSSLSSTKMYENWKERFQRWSNDESTELNKAALKIMHHSKRALHHLSLYESRRHVKPSLHHLPNHHHHPVAAASSSSSSTLSIYPDHLYPVHVDESFSTSSSSKRCCDVVFVHGLAGGPFASWKQDHASNTGTSNYVAQFWPRLWFPFDFSRRTKRSVRVLTFGFEARPMRTIDDMDLSSSVTLDMEEQAESLLHKLRMARIGSSGNSVVFVTHSLGGLVVKKMLMLAYERKKREEEREEEEGWEEEEREEEERDEESALLDHARWGGPSTHADISDNTRAVVFYSVPHKGSPMMDMLLSPRDTMVQLGLGAVHPITKWLATNYEESLLLNKEFGRVYGNCAMSIGETKRETLPGLIDSDVVSGFSEVMDLLFEDSGLIQIVPSSSANPGYGGFEEIQNVPHTTINKPHSMEDRRFEAMMEFVAAKCQV